MRLSNMSEIVVKENPSVMMTFPPYLSYRFPEYSDMIDNKIVPGNSKKPDKNADVSSTTCANIGKMVSVDNNNPKLIAIMMTESLNRPFLKSRTSSTGRVNFSCLLTNKMIVMSPMITGKMTRMSVAPTTLMLLNPNMNREKPTAENMIDVKSSLYLSFWMMSVIANIANTSVAMTSGSITQCNVRQSNTSMITPDIDGALAGATLTTAPSSPIANPLRSGGNMMSKIVCDSGKMIPAPIACSRREKMSTSNVGDHPPMSVPIASNSNAMMSSHFVEYVFDK